MLIAYNIKQTYDLKNMNCYFHFYCFWYTMSYEEQCETACVPVQQHEKHHAVPMIELLKTVQSTDCKPTARHLLAIRLQHCGLVSTDQRLHELSVYFLKYASAVGLV